MKEKILYLNLYIGILILLFSEMLLLSGNAFIKKWFFCFAWWSFILILDSINFRKDNSSPLSKSTKTFLVTIFISVFIWLIFEIINIRLNNWHYHGLPQNTVERWLGYLLSFATVVPALMEISQFLYSLFKKKNVPIPPLKVTPSLLKLCILSGIISILLVIIWPNIFFPLIWLSFIFILEPVNYKLGNKTFLSELERKSASLMISWLASGLLAGILWEFWNFWAGSHWEYSIPYFNFWKIFQMPLLGYLGFIPFAIEVFAFYQLLISLFHYIKKKKLAIIFIFLLLLIFYFVSFYLIDTFNLKT